MKAAPITQQESSPAPSPEVESTPFHFPATEWTRLVSVCRTGDIAMRENALEILCRDYWHPLYAFARRNGISPHDAEDLTQGFMSYVLERDLFSAADQGQGKLRTFLLVVFQRYIRDAKDRLNAQKRGGGQQFVSIEDHPEAAAAGLNPEVWFNRAWAQSLIMASISTLRKSEATAGRGKIFEGLEAFLNPEGISTANYQVAAYTLSLTEENVRKMVSRLRKKFRDCLRREIAATLSNPTDAEIDEELASLRAALQD